MEELRYLVSFAVGLGVTLAVTPVAVWLAHRVDALDHPDPRKSHTSPIPYLGGLAIIVGVVAAVLLGTVFTAQRALDADLIAIIGGAVALGLVGLADDLWGLGPAPRLLVETAVAAAVWAAGVGVSIFDAEPLNAALTIFWIVAITNAFNLLDNMDGLTAGVSAIAAGAFFVAALTQGQFLVASLAAVVAGTALGFLWHNFHPAKIFMGDAGALFFGFMLAVLGIRIRFPDSPTSATLWVPVLVLSVAVFDTSLVVISRLRDRRPVFKAAKDHVSHRLVQIGLRVRSSVLIIYLASASAGYLGLAVSLSTPEAAWMLIGLLAFLAVVAGYLLLAIDVRDVAVRQPETDRHDGPDS